jgi:hypothetical protein
VKERHWDGDVWVEASGYRVARKWVELYPHLFGPLKQDPDAGTGDVELDDTLTKAMSKIEGLGSVYSTWMERHCSETAFYIAYNFVESKDDVPPVPDFWIKEAHYWYMHITAGRLLKKEKTAEAGKSAAERALEIAQSCAPTVKELLKNPKVIALLTGALGTGWVVLPEILKIVGIA